MNKLELNSGYQQLYITCFAYFVENTHTHTLTLTHTRTHDAHAHAHAHARARARTRARTRTRTSLVQSIHTYLIRSQTQIHKRWPPCPRPEQPFEQQTLLL